jgi:exodeoxyribonuclease V alpha subunit
VTEAVVVEHILSAGRFGGAIFSASRPDGSRIRIVANKLVMPQPPVPGEIWSITGRLRKHPRYGSQVVADAVERERPSGRLIIQHLEKCPAFPGIGRARATALWNEFGGDLYELLDAGAVGELARIIGDDLALVLVQGWATQVAIGPVIRWLDRLGFPVRLARKIVAIWSSDAEDKLTENPYRMLAFASWNATDRAGLTIGIARNDDRRLVAAVEACCYRRLTFGHTYVGEDDLPVLVRGLLGCGADQAVTAVMAAEADHAVVRMETGWQPYGPWAMERFVAHQLVEMVAGQTASDQPALVRPVTAAEVDAGIQASEHRDGYLLNREQREAVHMVATSPVSIICGGAGVGKTTTLKAIHEGLEGVGGKVHQMALSGRAAMRLREVTAPPRPLPGSFRQRAISRSISGSTRWSFSTRRV